MTTGLRLTPYGRTSGLDYVYAVTDADTLTIAWSPSDEVDAEQTESPAEETGSASISLTNLRNCVLRNTADNSDYAVFALFYDTGDTVRSVSVFPQMLSSKTARTSAIWNSIEQTNIARKLGFVALPYSDSTFNDAIIISLPSGSSTLDGEAMTDVSDHAIGAAISNLPTVTLTESSGTVTAQLSEAKSGVEIYFETTAGSLSAVRATTDATGTASVTVTMASGVSGKVKAGFKHFTGAAEVAVSGA